MSVFEFMLLLRHSWHFFSLGYDTSIPKINDHKSLLNASSGNRFFYQLDDILPDLYAGVVLSNCSLFEEEDPAADLFRLLCFLSKEEIIGKNPIDERILPISMRIMESGFSLNGLVFTSRKKPIQTTWNHWRILIGEKK